MRSSYRTVAAASTLLGACETSEGARVQILAHYVPACAPLEGEAPAQLELIALGDFDRSNDSVSILPSDANAELVPLPPGTLAAQINTLGDRGYWGAGTLNTRGQIPVLLWPRNRACGLVQLPAEVSAGFAVQGFELGVSKATSTLLVVSNLGRREPGALAGVAINLDDGNVKELRVGADGGAPLADASISLLDGQFIVAGGRDPDSGRASTELVRFDAASARFDSGARLTVARSRHAALSLPNGGSLLIGGEGEDGEALANVEILAAGGERGGQVLELLGAARIEPHVLRLDGTRILVGGGYVPDPGNPGARIPVSSVEFSSLDLSDVPERPIRLEPAALDRAFVAMAPGGALATGGCSPDRVVPNCIPCDGGCVSREVWWIDPRGVAEELTPLPPELSVAAPLLVAAGGAAPFLIAGERLARFDPWTARFRAVEPSSPGPKGAAIAIDGGSFAWFEARDGSVELLGLYHSQRGAYAQDVAPLLVGSGLGIVPHRPPTTEGEPDLTLRYATSTGLELQGSAAVVSIADADYADFTLELTLESGPPPLLKLGELGAGDDTGTAFGGFECPWPESTPAQTGRGSNVLLSVRRANNELSLGVADEPASSEPCQASLPERVNIQLIGTPLGTTRLRRIEVRRSTD